MKTKSIYNLSYEKLSLFLIENKFKPFNAKQLWSWIYRKEAKSFDEMSDLSLKLRNFLSQNFTFELPRIDSISIARDGTKKYLLKLNDNLLVETVLIPEKERLTLCISCQIGCKLNCSFCATAQIGFKRDLQCFEIVGQLLQVQNEHNKRITNVVYMGMGEPFNNYDAVMDSASIISDDRGLAIGKRKITISTAGVIKNIRRYTAEDQRYRLAVSLHSPFQDERSSIMPVAKSNTLEDLFDALKEYTTKSNRKVVFEYILLNDINDTKRHVSKLISRLSKLPSKLNLIKYHENPFCNYKCSTPSNIDSFFKSFRNVNFPVVIRSSRGEDISAACGQLHLEKKNNKDK